jgi:hypothetical protein
VWYIIELFRPCGVFWNCSVSVVYFETVPTAWYILKLFWQIYHTVGTVSKYIPVSEQFQNIPRCRNSFKIDHRNFFDSVVYIRTVSTVRYISICSDSVVYFETFPTVWCILKLFRQCGVFWNFQYTTLSKQFQIISHFRNSSKIYHTVGTVPKYTTLSGKFQNIPHCRNSFKISTVWCILKLFRLCGVF